MWQRGLICLAMFLGVCVSFVAFVPAGPGPYTVVYGPASALRAQRAMLLLLLAIGFVSAVLALLAAASAAEFEPVTATSPGPFFGEDSALPLALRC